MTFLTWARRLDWRLRQGNVLVTVSCLKSLHRSQVSLVVFLLRLDTFKGRLSTFSTTIPTESTPMESKELVCQWRSTSLEGWHERQACTRPKTLDVFCEVDTR